MNSFNWTAETGPGWEGVPVSLSVRSTPLLKAFLVRFSRNNFARAFLAPKLAEGGLA